MIQSNASTPLLDLLSPGDHPATSGDLAPVHSPVEAARSLMMLALANYVALRQFDQGMGGLALNRRNRAAAVAMRSLYEQWASQADELLSRMRQLGLRNSAGSDFECLDTAVARTRAMLSVTLESLDQADEELRAGRTCTLEEVRRELRAAAGRPGEAGAQRAPVRGSGNGA